MSIPDHAMDQYPVLLSDSHQHLFEGIFMLDEDVEPCTVTFVYAGERLTQTGEDHFAAFCAIRRLLEHRGLLVACYGASLQVYPSPMARAMGTGLYAYKLTMGQPAHPRDLVSIFATGPDVHPATVDQQAAFSDAWLASLGRT